MTEHDLIDSSNDLWQKAISLLQEVMTTEQERSQMERYFPLITSHAIENNEYVVGLSEQFQVDWLGPKFALPLERALHTVGLSKSSTVSFSLS